MNKRSAMLVAAGLVLTLIVGGMAVAVGLTGPSSSAAAPRITDKQKARKPIVKTVERTITVRKQAPSVAAPAVTYTSSDAPTSADYSGSASSDSSYSENGSYEDSQSQEQEDSQSQEQEDSQSQEQEDSQSQEHSQEPSDAQSQEPSDAQSSAGGDD